MLWGIRFYQGGTFAAGTRIISPSALETSRTSFHDASPRCQVVSLPGRGRIWMCRSGFVGNRGVSRTTYPSISVGTDAPSEAASPQCRPKHRRFLNDISRIRDSFFYRGLSVGVGGKVRISIHSRSGRGTPNPCRQVPGTICRREGDPQFPSFTRPNTKP